MMMPVSLLRKCLKIYTWKHAQCHILFDCKMSTASFSYVCTDERKQEVQGGCFLAGGKGLDFCASSSGNVQDQSHFLKFKSALVTIVRNEWPLPLLSRPDWEAWLSTVRILNDKWTVMYYFVPFVVLPLGTVSRIEDKVQTHETLTQLGWSLSVCVRLPGLPESLNHLTLLLIVTLSAGYLKSSVF